MLGSNGEPTVRGNVLLLTSVEIAEIDLVVRVYPVQDLVEVQWDGDSGLDYDALISVIEQTVHPDGWLSLGGTASMEPLPNERALVVNATLKMHRQLEQTLTDIRRARRLQGISPLVPEPDAEGMT